MYFKTKKEFLIYLSYLKVIGLGSQGVVYFDRRSNKVFKVFHQFFEDYDEDFYVKYTDKELLRFSSVDNNTFVWACDVVYVCDEVVGYISNYVKANSLYKQNPLEINLDSFNSSILKSKEDIKIISNNGIKTYDVMYNILYNDNVFKVIDYDEYSYSDIDSNTLYRINCDNFNYEVMYFLIDNYFDEFISSYKDLKEMYAGSDVDINEFITLFRKYLSEVVGKEIITLYDARKCLNKKKSGFKYQRGYLK